MHGTSQHLGLPSDRIIQSRERSVLVPFSVGLAVNGLLLFFSCAVRESQRDGSPSHNAIRSQEVQFSRSKFVFLVDWLSLAVYIVMP